MCIPHRSRSCPSKTQVQTKKRITLAKRFKCPFCTAEEAVECKMDQKRGTGSLACRLCGASFQMPIHHLHEPIDVFSEWLDECEAVARQSSGGGDMGGGGAIGSGGGGGRAAGAYEEESDDEADLPASSGLHTGGRGGDKSGAPATTVSSTSSGGAPKTTSYATLGLDDSESDED